MYGYEKQLHLPFTAFQNELRQLLKLTHKRCISTSNMAIFQLLSTSHSTETITTTDYTQNGTCLSLWNGNGLNVYSVLRKRTP